MVSLNEGDPMSLIDKERPKAVSVGLSLSETRERLRNKLSSTINESLHNKVKVPEHAVDLIESIGESMTEPVDAKVEIYVDHDKMTAYARVFPPENNGADIHREMILKALTTENIIYGIDPIQLDAMVERKPYMEKIPVAFGRPPVDGKDGEIIDCFEREKSLKFAEKINGGIDFKTLNIITAVDAGTVICTITEPMPSLPGTDVYGAEAIGREGKSVYIPQGVNTILSSDGLKLLAGETGNLVFRNNKFTIDPVFEVRGNVDNSIGNIDFPGDVTVLGDVFEGFQIKAKGNVTVFGRVEGASIFSEGCIVLKNGMNGMNKGELEANGDITSNYLENCKASTRSNLNVDSIVNSIIYCNGCLTASGKRGAIIGGSCSVQKAIEAKSIGSRANLLTTIVLGAASEWIAERQQITDELAELEKNFENLAKNLDYLETRVQPISLPPERQKIFEAMKREKPINLIKQAQLRKRLEKINKQLDDVESSRLKCMEIFPHTKITIGNATMVTQVLYNQCIMYYSEGAIKTTYY